MTAFLRIGDNIVTHAIVHVPTQGPWYADVDLEGNPDLSGSATLSIGDTLDLVGTIDPRFTGTGALQRRARLVAGAGGWGKKIIARGYHDDAGVWARLVAEDAARDAGETLSVFSGGTDTLGKDFARLEGAASIALEQAAGGVPWWVDYAGQTHVEAHPSSMPAGTAYEVLEYDPRARLVELTVDDPHAVRIGATLTERLDAPLVVRELHIVVAETIRLQAWCSPADTAQGRLLDSIRAIVRRVTGKIYGPIRYRVVRMLVDRYELQVVRRGFGAPDLVPLSAWPGVAGSHSVAQLGAEVLVQFIEGDPGQPIVTHFAGKDGNGWIPTEVMLAASSLVRLGSDTANRALALAAETKAQLDTLQIAHDLHKHGTLGGGLTGVPDTLVGALGPIASTKVVTDG